MESICFRESIELLRVSFGEGDEGFIGREGVDVEVFFDFVEFREYEYMCVEENYDCMCGFFRLIFCVEICIFLWWS